MSPQKQLLIGTSTGITGVLLQIIVGLRASSVSESMIEGANKDGQAVEHMDHLLEQAHMEMLWMFAGIILSWFLIAVGVAVVIWGTYRYFTARKRTNALTSPTTNA